MARCQLLPGLETAETMTDVQRKAAKRKLKTALLQNQWVSQLWMMVPEQNEMCSLWLSQGQCCGVVLMKGGRHSHQEISRCVTAAAEKAQHACSNNSEDLPKQPVILIQSLF